MIDGAVFVTDNGNYIYDCRFERIDDPQGLELAMRRHAGIIESGLFLGMADLVLIANDRDVEERQRQKPAAIPAASGPRSPSASS
jgi:ribose 5-phosphate isomerase A